MGRPQAPAGDAGSLPVGETPSPGRDLPEHVEVGRVRRPHGVRGDLLVDAWSEVGGRFERGSVLVLRTAAGARRPVRVESSRPHAGGLLVRFAGMASRDDVEPLRGAVFEVPREESPAAGEGAFYYFELAGCVCSDRRQGELGTVREVLEDGGGVLLEVEAPDRRLLIPFVAAYVEAVDVAGGRIELDLPAGLVETCASTS